MEPNKKIIVKARKPVNQPASEPMRVTAPPGAVPLPAGTRVYLDSELRVMDILGVKPGETLPEEFKEHMKAELADEKRRLAELGGKPNLKDKKVTIEDLPAAKQNELRDLLQQIKSDNKQSSIEPRYMVQGVANLPPELANTVAAVENTESKKFVGKVIGGGERAPQTPSRDTTPQPVREEVSQTGVTTPPKECVVCGWPHGKPIDAAPTDDDKLNYLLAIESGKKFKKSYSLFGGRITVVLQVPSVKDYERCLREIDKKRAAGDLLSIDHAAALIADYRLALSISQIVTPQSSQGYPESAKDWVIDDEGVEKPMSIDEILEHFHNDSPVKDDGLWRAIGHVWQRFNSINAVLEMHAADPNFYQAIETRK